VLTDRCRDSADIEVVRLADILANSVQLLNNGVARLHVELPDGSSSGVQIIGAVKPAERQIASIVLRMVACDVLAVPRQQIFDLVSGSDTDMKGIDGRLLRERTSPNQLAREPSRLVGDRESRNASQYPQSAGTCCRVAYTSLVPNDL